MEKDYFKDRTKDITERKNLSKGTQVFICTKKMQPYAKSLPDLNLVTITQNLTSAEIHPRGQKIMGIERSIDDFGNLLIQSNGETINEELVGRCTYIVNPDGISVNTTEGLKYLSLTKNKQGKPAFCFLTEEEAKQKYYVIGNFLLDNELLIEVPIMPYSYFNSKEELVSKIRNFSIKDCVLHMGFITAIVNGHAVKFEQGYSEGTTISDPKFNDYIANNFNSINDTAFAFNKKYMLKIKNISITQID